MAAPVADWLTSRPDGVRLSVKVTPRSSGGGLQGVEVDGRGQAYLVVRVAAPPEGGKANAATIKLLARHCGVAASALSLVSGAGSRRKVLDIHGEADLLARRLKALAADR
jgi:uncharacterized protein (TIGR00251 family)